MTIKCPNSNWNFVLIIFAILLVLAVLSFHNNESLVQAQLNYNAVKDSNRIHSCRDNLSGIASAVRAYAADHEGEVPSNLQELCPSYMKSLPCCQSMNRVTYSLKKTKGNGFVIFCKGCNHGESPDDYPRYDSREGILLAPGKPLE